MAKTLICVDASLALKLILCEEDSAQAQQLWDTWIAQGVTLIVPTLWGYEVTSVIRRYAYRGQIAPVEETLLVATVLRFPVHPLSPQGLHYHAWRLAQRYNRPVTYDAHYLALAEMVGCPFWTSDQRLYQSVHVELPWVHCLGETKP